MNKKIIKSVLAILTLTAITATALADEKYIAGFSGDKAGNFPKGWRTRPGQMDGAKKVYKIVQEGDSKYLSADDTDGTSVQIFKMAYWKLNEYPILKWKWRARKLPAGANETDPAKNDSACGIYISFGMSRGKALKYVWSTTAPTGTFYKKNDDMYIIVKRSGAGSLGSWAHESTNVVEDAKKTFGAVPDRDLSGVAILTDNNATKSPASCDYESIGYASE